MTCNGPRDLGAVLASRYWITPEGIAALEAAPPLPEEIERREAGAPS